MNNISISKKKYQKYFSKKYYGKSFEDLQGVDLFCCSLVAETSAYIDNIIPEDFIKLNIFDFDGYTQKKELLIPVENAMHSKNIICEYCWGKTWKQINEKFNRDKNKIKEFFRKKMVLMERLKNGNNVIIYGETSDKRGIGRTMAASIIMKQAIKLRLLPFQKSQTYNWIDFSILKEIIKKDTNELSFLKSCDWLVVDNVPEIKFASGKQSSYISGLIDPFFLSRITDKLPTIIVFRFNLDREMLDIEEQMGIGISKIINNNKTYKIKLN